MRNETLALLWSEALGLRFSAFLPRSRTLWFLSDLISRIPRSFQRSLQNAAHPSFWFLLCRELPAAPENRDNETAQKQMCAKVIWEHATRGKGELAHLRAPGGFRRPWAPAVHSTHKWIYTGLKRNQWKEKVWPFNAQWSSFVSDIGGRWNVAKYGSVVHEVKATEL